MTKHEADVIGGLNMTDQISNEAYKQIMIAAQDENEVGEVLDKIGLEIAKEIVPRDSDQYDYEARWQNMGLRMALKVIYKYKAESGVSE